MQLNRRQFALASLGAAGAAACGVGLPALAQAGPLHLRASTLDASILPGLTTTGMMSFAPDGAPPLLRMRQGQRSRILVDNQLGEVTTVHWHGVRLPNAQDGVPYITQFPIGVGETWTYDFVPADAGTYWYHPHCNTLDQMGRGMTGLLIVDEAVDPGFDADIALNIRDFRLGKDGQFLDFLVPRSASRGGTLGTVSTANWQVDGVTDAPAGGLVRLRLGVTDMSRIYKLAVSGAESLLVALDGHPLAVPQRSTEAMVAPGQRADFALIMPAEGQEVQIFMNLPGGKTRPLARLRATGPGLGRALADLAPLPANPVPAPDLATAEVIDFVIGWTPEGGKGGASICGDMPYAFWSINRKVWPGDVAKPFDPIANLTLGRSYIFRFSNETENNHPIHLHGMAFKVLRSNKRDILQVTTDTVLLESHETVDIAFVADNPGDWVLHCHVIEHQKTGLAAFVRVA